MLTILFILCKFKFNFYILVESVKKNSALGNQLNKMYISMQTVIPIPSSMQCPCVRMTFGSSSLPLIPFITIAFFVLLKNYLQFMFTFFVMGI